MKTFIYNEYIAIEHLEKLMKSIEKTEDNEITIYFTSEGGNVCDALTFIDWLNNSQKDITIVACYQITSSATLILFGANIKRRILRMAWGVIHLAETQLSIKALNRNDTYEVGRKGVHDKADEYMLNEYKRWGIPAHEIELIKKGEDVFLNSARLRVIDERLKKVDK